MREGSKEEKIKAMAYCTCVAGADGHDLLQRAGVVAPLVKVLVNGDEAEKLWSVSALGQLIGQQRNKSS